MQNGADVGILCINCKRYWFLVFPKCLHWIFNSTIWTLYFCLAINAHMIERSTNAIRGFVKLQKNKIIREQLGSGRLGQAPALIIIFFDNFVLFCVIFFFLLKMFKKQLRNE